MTDVHTPVETGSASAGEKAGKQTVRTFCRLCRSKCPMLLTLQDGVITEVNGDSSYTLTKGYLCPKGRALTEIVYAEDRIQHPMKRNGTSWQRISWEEAYEIIGDKISAIKNEYGAQAVAIHTGKALVGQYVEPFIGTFCNAFGTPNFMTVGSQCHAARVIGNKLTIGAFPMPDYLSSKCTVLWGLNPSTSDPTTAKKVVSSLENGGKLIVIDPSTTPLTPRADLHLKIRPGTDGALALGFLNILIQEGLVDREFVNTWTTGFDELVPLVKDYTPDVVETITWIPAELVTKAALMYGSIKPACISAGNSLEHHSNSMQAIRAISILQAVTGNIDIIGGIMMRNTMKLSEADSENKAPLAGEAIGEKEFPIYHKFTGKAQANYMEKAVLTGEPYPLKGMIITGSNPVLTFPNSVKVEEALHKLDFLAVIDLFMTRTAQCADIVLPGVTFLEREEVVDLGAYTPDTRPALMQQIIPEYGESKPNWKIWLELGQSMGYGDHFRWKSMKEAIADRIIPNGITYDQLEQEYDGIITAPRQEKKYEQKGFPTPSGLVEIYSKQLEQCGYNPLPMYEEPGIDNSDRAATAEDYPLILNIGTRKIEYMHSCYRNIPSLIKRVPDHFAEINPILAERAGVTNTDHILVETNVGQLRMPALITDDVPDGVVRMTHGWDSSNANELVDDWCLDPISGYPEYRSMKCRISRV